MATFKSVDQLNGTYAATIGTLTVTAGQDIGSYVLYPAKAPYTTPSNSPSGYFSYNNLLYPTTNPLLDGQGLLFLNSTLEINLWGNSVNNYEFYDNTGRTLTGSPASLTPAPGGGITYPAKFVFDVNATPNCVSDYVVMGIQANGVSGGQANLVGYNNIYSAPNGSGYCAVIAPTVAFSYASGSGQVPADVSISQDGKRLAFVENIGSGSSYFHSLTLGTTGINGTSPTAAAVPGTGNNAVDQRVLLSPDAGVTTQSSTTAPFVVFSANDASDVAYVTTYSRTGTGSGYLYKIGNVFSGTSAPAIVWSIAINAVPSTPVFDSVSKKVFFTDSNGRIDYVLDSGTSGAINYGTVVGSGATSENAVVLDSSAQMVYATFNSNGTNAIVVQTPTTFKTSTSISVGTANTTYSGPYTPDFNNAFYTGTGIPQMYVAGTGATGTQPTLYGIGFNSGRITATGETNVTLTSGGSADSSPVTEYYNSALGKDFLFVGVTNHCKATILGSTAGCVMSLDITNGSPTVTAVTTALPAAGGTTGIIVDNDSSLSQASSIYYGTKAGGTLVKATQTGLN